MELTREWVAAVTGGRMVGPPGAGRDAEEPIGEGISFDSRLIEPGQVFLALRDLRDGHDFVADAAQRGAAFSIVDHPVVGQPTVEVSDTHRALTMMATAARQGIDAPVVGITGSVGKTSTKDLTAAALRARFRTHAAPASFNNEIGVPVTMLGAPADVEVLVLELGARFAGNIADLCALAQPSIGVITNIGIAHAEHLGGPEGVAAVKGELLDSLPSHGLAVIGTDTASAGQRHRSAATVMTVGSTPDADVRVSGIEVDADLRPQFRLETPWGSGQIALTVRGAHQVINAAQAATVALHLGVPMPAMIDALRHAASTGWRMQLTVTGDGVHVINDAYNASPVATLAAIEALAALAVRGRRIAVLGEMRELGECSAAEHARVGDAIARRHIDVLVAVGAETEALASAAEDGSVVVYRALDVEAARSLVLELATPGDAVLVKASRAVGLEVVALALLGVEVPA